MQWRRPLYVHSRVGPSHCDDSCLCNSLIQHTADCRARSVLFHGHICCLNFVQLIYQQQEKHSNHFLFALNCPIFVQFYVVEHLQ